MLDKAKSLSAEMIRLRRDIHAHPELSFQEIRTAQLVADTLHEIGGITVKTGVGKTGVVGELSSGHGPTIAIRADMDALPILEQTGAPYASTHQGVMHACGHDAHTAMLLGVAHLLKDSFATDGLQGTVRFLFQPAEENNDSEGISGAPRMIEDGAMAGVDAVIALHVESTRPTGQICAPSGWSSAAVDSFEAWLVGAGGHGAYPHETVDPLWLLSPVLTALHGIVARRINPMQPAVMSLGQVHGGTASNVIPPEVYIEGTLRSFDEEVRQALLAEVERALSIVRPLGGDYRFKVWRGYPAGWNDPAVSGWLKQVAGNFIGADHVFEEGMGMGAEDFAYMCQEAPGAMFLLGAALPDGVERAHHANNFDIDESALPLGAAVLAETARRFLTGDLKLTGTS
ncbi:MAG: amidohydrolase [Anaerolineae bacterium]|nr:amidohydrolase [Anaerolineae bacterium]